MLFETQAQVTLVAPAATTTSWKCRQAATKLGLRPHEYQVPFISHQGARRNGWPQAFAAAAQLLIAVSWAPLATCSRVTPPARGITTTGIAPRFQARSMFDLANVTHGCPTLSRATFLPACRSKRSH